jgi:hypothetical protein
MFEDILPALIMGLMMSGAVAIVALSMYYRNRKHREEQETIRAALEKGVDIPPDLFKKENGGNGTPTARKGIYWTMIGISLFIALYVTAGIRGAVWALIPFALGIGCLLASRSEKSSDS